MSNPSPLSVRIRQNALNFDSAFSSFSAELPMSKAWIQRESVIAGDKPSGALLLGAKLAILEAGTSWALGVNRGAASSLRVFIENTVSWLYYKDHHVEYNSVIRGNADLMLPKKVQEYLKANDLGHTDAYAFLHKSATRPDEYFYSNVSNFVHAHPAFSQGVTNLVEDAVSLPAEAGFLPLCANVDEFISDIFAAHYRASWADVPQTVTTNISGRLGNKLSSFLNVV